MSAAEAAQSWPFVPSPRPTVVCVQHLAPLGVGTPHVVSVRASAWCEVTPSLRNRRSSRNSLCAARSAACCRARAAAPLSGPAAGR